MQACLLLRVWIPGLPPKAVASRQFTISHAKRPMSYLQLVRSVDAVPNRIHQPEAYAAFMKEYYRFKIKGYSSTLGLIPEIVVKMFQWPQCWTIEHDVRALTLSQGSNIEERSYLLSETYEAMAWSRNIVDLDKPKGEMLPVFGPGSEHLLNIDRAAAMMFGTVSYGIQMLAHTRTEQGIRYWIPRRANTKRSYPGMLDNCVGGALNTGGTPLTCLIREASEEASLPEKYVQQNAKPYGVVSYHMATDGNGEKGHQPQVMYVYHIELPLDIVPTPSDGEVEKFELMTLKEIQTALKNGEFKTNCIMTWVSYMISTGVINAENEPDLYKITTHLHRRLDFPTK